VFAAFVWIAEIHGTFVVIVAVDVGVFASGFGETVIFCASVKIAAVYLFVNTSASGTASVLGTCGMVVAINRSVRASSFGVAFV